VNRADSPVIPVRIDVGGEENGSCKREKLDCRCDRDDNGETIARCRREKPDAADVDGEGRRDCDEVAPRPSVLAALVFGSKWRALRIGKCNCERNQPQTRKAGDLRAR
jgi:hypothetical protein